MRREEARVGVVVRTNVTFVSVPKGTIGDIDEDYGSGIMVAWRGIPSGLGNRRLRDGFDKKTELQYLDSVEP